jgi:hypothetical protein
MYVDKPVDNSGITPYLISIFGVKKDYEPLYIGLRNMWLCGYIGLSGHTKTLIRMYSN